MIHVYINYPQPHLTIHRDAGCGLIQMHAGAQRRVVAITRETLAAELRRFVEREHRFATGSHLNDMWLRISLDTPEQEIGVVRRTFPGGAALRTTALPLLPGALDRSR